MPTPIFVLGKHRSGTTWLGNQLCQHSLVAGITHEEHFGMLESAYFTCVYNRYGDLANKNNFIEFVEVMSTSDYFRLAGATKEFSYSLWPTTYEHFFRAVMDHYAAKQGAAYWLEKSPSHSVMVNQLAAIYPDAMFIAIVRDVEAVVASGVALRASREPEFAENAWLRRRNIIRIVLSWTYYNKTLKAFGVRSERMSAVRYETLRADPANTLRSVCSFLGLSFEPRMLDQSFVLNTSFPNQTGRGQALSGGEKELVYFTQRLFSLIPLWILTLIDRTRRRMKKRRSLPSWFFSLLPFPEDNRQPAGAVTSEQATNG